MCTLIPIPAVPAVCGDGTREVPEECDDGNLINDDGCSSQCTIESNGVICGDGVRLAPVDAPIGFDEQCDDGNLNAGDGCSEA